MAYQRFVEIAIGGVFTESKLLHPDQRAAVRIAGAMLLLDALLRLPAWATFLTHAGGLQGGLCPAGIDPTFWETAIGESSYLIGVIATPLAALLALCAVIIPSRAGLPISAFFALRVVDELLVFARERIEFGHYIGQAVGIAFDISAFALVVARAIVPGLLLVWHVFAVRYEDLLTVTVDRQPVRVPSSAMRALLIIVVCGLAVRACTEPYAIFSQMVLAALNGWLGRFFSPGWLKILYDIGLIALAAVLLMTAFVAVLRKRIAPFLLWSLWSLSVAMPIVQTLRIAERGAAPSLHWFAVKSYIPAMLLFVAFLQSVERRRQRDASHIVCACGYIVAGLKSDRCPECGREVRSAHL